MDVAALILDKIIALKFVGSTELLSWVPDMEIDWIGNEIGEIRATGCCVDGGNFLTIVLLTC